MPEKDHESIRISRESIPELEAASFMKRFLHHDLVGTGVLLAAALSAFIVANVGFGEQYHHLWELEFGLDLAGTVVAKPLHLWVNDGLMAIFFFLVGLEIKRELVAGELATFSKAILPAVAALGGMIVPALIYTIVNRGGDGTSGWGIPMATDIAFAAGCIAMLKKRVPPALMVFLVALAIADDLGAVAVIAFFYTDQLNFSALLVGGSLILISAAMGQAGVRRTAPYVAVGILVWLAFLQSGVHATIAGVLLAFTIPTDARYRSELFEGRLRELLARFAKADDERKANLEHPDAPGKSRLLVSPRQQSLIRAMNEECHHVEAPLQRIEYNLEPLAVFVIMPIFAFANSGLQLDWSRLGEYLVEPVTLGIFFGLVAGKQIGIVAASYIAVKTGIAKLPAGVNWKQIWAVSWLAGIGFTMSLFIAELAFPAADAHGAQNLLLDQAKLGIFCASIFAGIVGLIILRLACPNIIQPQSAQSNR